MSGERCVEALGSIDASTSALQISKSMLVPYQIRPALNPTAGDGMRHFVMLHKVPSLPIKFPQNSRMRFGPEPFASIETREVYDWVEEWKYLKFTKFSYPSSLLISRLLARCSRA